MSDDDEAPIIDIKAVNIMKWVMNEYSGTLEKKAVNYEIQIRRQGWGKNHWQALPVEEIDGDKDE